MPFSDPTPIFIFDNPRTCSQLLYRFFSSHPQLETAKAYQWATAAATCGPDRIQLRVANTERSKAADQDFQQQIRVAFAPLGVDLDNESYDTAARRLGETVTASRNDNDKLLLVKEHAACSLKPPVMDELLRTGDVANLPENPTALPDDTFAKIKRPVLLIRHPALVLESFFRAQVHFGYEPSSSGFEFFTTPRSTRLLFDHLRDRDPIVIDAEDVVYRSEALCAALCEIWGIEAGGVQYTWDQAPENPEGPQNPGRADFFGTLDRSTRPVRGEEKAVDLEAEYEVWRSKFGVSVAEALRRRVEDYMPDYEYLQQFRLRV